MAFADVLHAHLLGMQRGSTLPTFRDREAQQISVPLQELMAAIEAYRAPGESLA